MKPASLSLCIRLCIHGCEWTGPRRDGKRLIARFFSKLRHFRRIATRYDKLAENFLGMVKLASVRLWLRAFESTT